MKGSNVKCAKLLIDAAVKVCGSQAEVARQMGVPRVSITQWKNGTRPLSPEDAALLADLANMDARQAVVDAVIERNAGTPKGRVLLDILGKALAASVAGLLVLSYGDSSATDTGGQIRNRPAIDVINHRI